MLLPLSLPLSVSLSLSVSQVTVYMGEPEAEQAECNQIHIPLSCRMWEFLS